MDPDPDHQGHERGKDRDLAPRQVGKGAVLRLLERVEQNALDHGKHVVGGEDHARGGDHGRHAVLLERPQQRQELAHEAARAGQSDRRQRRDHEGGGEERRGASDPPEVVHQASSAPFVHHAQQQEQRPRGDAVADHDHQTALETVHRQGEHADHHEPHVGNRGVGDQLLGVGLNRRDPGGVDDPDGSQRQHDRRDHGVLRRLREERQEKAQEPVRAHLEQHGGQDHRARRGRLHVRVGQPSVKREHRHLDPERQGEGGEEPQLLSQRQVGGQERVVGERIRAGGKVDVEDRHQHEQGPRRRVQEELDRRVDAPLAAPDAHDEVHRHQGELEEDVEEQEVRRHEDAHHAHLQQEHQRVERPSPGGHVLEGPQNRQRRGQCREDHHEQGDPVQAHRVVRAPGGDPRRRGLEGERAPGRVVGPPESGAQHEERRRPGERDVLGALLGRRQHVDRADRRSPDEGVEDPAAVSDRGEKVRHGIRAREPRRPRPGGRPGRARTRTC